MLLKYEQACDNDVVKSDCKNVYIWPLSKINLCIAELLIGDLLKNFASEL